MRFNNASHVLDLVWQMRLADLPRGENRTIINQLYNGDPPYDEAKAEENNIEINRNDLEGVNLLAQARRQWNTAFLSSERYFTVTVDAGAKHKRSDYGRTITKHANRHLKKSLAQMEQCRETGANAILHGPAPSTWEDRFSVVPRTLASSSVLIPSETLIDFSNCSYIAFFKEWTPAELWGMTHGPRVDKGWQMPLVNSQMRYVANQVLKQPNATAFQYMPERIEELFKQDLGMWSSDAVPTIDAWDFYFREDEDGKGWYRRIILDWSVVEGTFSDRKRPPNHPNPDADENFLYTSGEKKYCNSMSEFFACNHADCSAVPPFKYHSERSLGWMLWGICDLQNRLHCKFNESVFQQLMWFFRVASNKDMVRLKQSNFTHLGVIPAGIDWIKAQERYAPPTPLVEMAFNRNRSLMNDSASSFSQQLDRGARDKEMTATETMAVVNQVNALVSGLFSLSYTYEDFKYREECRRLCLKVNASKMAKAFQKDCLQDGVPTELLDVCHWDVHADRVLGAGNKTIALAQAQFLQGIRKNLGPDGQREADHLAIAINTDDPALAERLAPMKGQTVATTSMHDAQLMTERLMRGLPVVPRPDMVYEDYVKVWLADLEIMVNRDQNASGMTSAEDILGFQNMQKEIDGFLQIIGQNEEEVPKVKEYAQRLANVMNLVKAFEQRLRQQVASKNGKGQGADPKAAAEIQADLAKNAVKIQNMRESHSQRTAQRQISAELEQQRRDREVNAEIRRENAKAAHERLRESTGIPQALAE